MSKTLFFQGGTLVLDDIGQQEQVPAPFQWVKGRWRCEGYHYESLLPWLRTQHIRDLVPRWQTLALPLHDRREAHAYQLEALDAWEASSRRGSIVLPTAWDVQPW